MSESSAAAFDRLGAAGPPERPRMLFGTAAIGVRAKGSCPRHTALDYRLRSVGYRSGSASPGSRAGHSSRTGSVALAESAGHCHLGDQRHDRVKWPPPGSTIRSAATWLSRRTPVSRRR